MKPYSHRTVELQRSLDEELQKKQADIILARNMEETLYHERKKAEGELESVTIHLTEKRNQYSLSQQEKLLNEQQNLIRTLKETDSQLSDFYSRQVQIQPESSSRIWNEKQRRFNIEDIARQKQLQLSQQFNNDLKSLVTTIKQARDLGTDISSHSSSHSSSQGSDSRLAAQTELIIVPKRKDSQEDAFILNREYFQYLVEEQEKIWAQISRNVDNLPSLVPREAVHASEIFLKMRDIMETFATKRDQLFVLQFQIELLGEKLNGETNIGTAQEKVKTLQVEIEQLAHSALANAALFKTMCDTVKIAPFEQATQHNESANHDAGVVGNLWRSIKMFAHCHNQLQRALNTFYTCAQQLQIVEWCKLLAKFTKTPSLNSILQPNCSAYSFQRRFDDAYDILNLTNMEYEQWLTTLSTDCDVFCNVFIRDIISNELALTQQAVTQLSSMLEVEDVSGSARCGDIGQTWVMIGRFWTLWRQIAGVIFHSLTIIFGTTVEPDIQSMFDTVQRMILNVWDQASPQQNFCAQEQLNDNFFRQIQTFIASSSQVITDVSMWTKVSVSMSIADSYKQKLKENINVIQQRATDQRKMEEEKCVQLKLAMLQSRQYSSFASDRHVFSEQLQHCQSVVDELKKIEEKSRRLITDVPFWVDTITFNERQVSDVLQAQNNNNTPKIRIPAPSPETNSLQQQQFTSRDNNIQQKQISTVPDVTQMLGKPKPENNSIDNTPVENPSPSNITEPPPSPPPPPPPPLESVENSNFNSRVKVKEKKAVIKEEATKVERESGNPEEDDNAPLIKPQRPEYPSGMSTEEREDLSNQYYDALNTYKQKVKERAAQEAEKGAAAEAARLQKELDDNKKAEEQAMQAEKARVERERKAKEDAELARIALAKKAADEEKERVRREEEEKERIFNALPEEEKQKQIAAREEEKRLAKEKQDLAEAKIAADLKAIEDAKAALLLEEERKKEEAKRLLAEKKAKDLEDIKDVLEQATSRAEALQLSEPKDCSYSSLNASGFWVSGRDTEATEKNCGNVFGNDANFAKACSELKVYQDKQCQNLKSKCEQDANDNITGESNASKNNRKLYIEACYSQKERCVELANQITNNDAVKDTLLAKCKDEKQEKERLRDCPAEKQWTDKNPILIGMMNEQRAIKSVKEAESRRVQESLDPSKRKKIEAAYMCDNVQELRQKTLQSVEERYGVAFRETFAGMLPTSKDCVQACKDVYAKKIMAGGKETSTFNPNTACEDIFKTAGQKKTLIPECKLSCLEDYAPLCMEARAALACQGIDTVNDKDAAKQCSLIKKNCNSIVDCILQFKTYKDRRIELLKEQKQKDDDARQEIIDRLLKRKKEIADGTGESLNPEELKEFKKVVEPYVKKVSLANINSFKAGNFGDIINLEWFDEPYLREMEKLQGK